MTETSNQELLRSVVIQKSKATTWDLAKTEWDLLTIYDEDSRCVCEHFIRENCVIRNRINGEELTVGNVCINHFGVRALTVPASCRACFSKLREYPQSTNANQSLLSLAHRLNILSANEVNYYSRITTGVGSRTKFSIGHEKFSQTCFDIRLKINTLIKLGFSPRRPRCDCKGRRFAKPRQNRTGTFFYSCADWPHGCGFTASS
jgi:hypothetical protein